MEYFNFTICDIISQLEQNEKLGDITFMSEYPAKDKPTPIDHVYVTVGFAGVKITKKSFADYIGELSGEQIKGRQAYLELKFRIYSPRTQGGEGCMDVFSNICEELLFGKSKYFMDDAECKKMSYDIQTSSIVLEASIKFNVFLKV